MNLLIQKMNQHFREMTDSHQTLYRVDVSGDVLWDTYLNGFQTKPIFKDPNSNEYNCNCCKHFITHYGNIVCLTAENSFISIFDFIVPSEYGQTIKELQKVIHSSKILCPFIITRDSYAKHKYDKDPDSNREHLGISQNHRIYSKEEIRGTGLKANELYTFNHFYLSIPSRYILDTQATVPDLVSKAIASKDALARALTEFSVDTIELAIDLINQRSLLNCENQLDKLSSLLRLKKLFDDVPNNQRDIWLWKQAEKFPYCHIYGELIGTLLKDLSSKDIEEACKAWNYRVDPQNYMKVQKPITPTQVKLAQKFAEDNGYIESFTRRCATIEDISVSEILHINNTKHVLSIFDSIKTTSKPLNLSSLPSISIDQFMKDILPTSTQLEVYFDNKHIDNLVTLITSENKNSKKMFKWNNNFSWTYINNLSGKSLISQRVKSAGGYIDSPFRFSIMWNENGLDICDLDAHLKLPKGREIYYANKEVGPWKLDVDMIRPKEVGVENIFLQDNCSCEDGLYKFFIENYDGGRNTGCKAELSVFGQVFTYKVDSIHSRETIASIYIKDGHVDSITHYIDPVELNQTVYGLETNSFYPVTLMCLSPNYWQESVGNKHYFFFISNCIADTSLRGFHNEFLNSELAPHRKVLDVLAYQMKVESTKNQLSGLGFNSTITDEVIVKVNKNKLFKIKFNV